MTFAVGRNVISATVLVLATAAVSLHADPVQAAAAPRVPYQTQIDLTCSNGHCSAKFPGLADKFHLELQKVSCHAILVTPGTIYAALVSYPLASGAFTYNLALESRAFSGGNYYDYVFGQDGPFIVPSGKELIAELRTSQGIAGTARCSLFGEKVG